MLGGRGLGGFGEGLTGPGGEEEVDALRVCSDELLAEWARGERGPGSLHVSCEARGDDGGLVCGAATGRSAKPHANEGLGLWETYFSTIGRVCCSTAASSFNRCGLFPVLSSCSMTPTTISSFMPSVSTLKPARSPGDGGGVVSATRLAVDRSRSCLIFGDDDDEEALGEGMVGDCDGAELELSQRFNFLAGG